MLDVVRPLLEQSPMLALFAAIGIGYAIGRISIAGFSLDIGAVLFAGLALGAIAPKAAPPALVSSIGLVMFLYGIGIQYGAAVLRGPGRLRPEMERARRRGVCCARSAVALVAGRGVRRVARAHAGHVRRSADQHAGAAGRHRCRRRPLARDRILGRLSGRHHRAHPLHLRLLAARDARLAPAPAPPATVEIVLADEQAGHRRSPK